MRSTWIVWLASVTANALLAAATDPMPPAPAPADSLTQEGQDSTAETVDKLPDHLTNKFDLQRSLRDRELSLYRFLQRVTLTSPHQYSAMDRTTLGKPSHVAAPASRGIRYNPSISPVVPKFIPSRTQTPISGKALPSPVIKASQVVPADELQKKDSNFPAAIQRSISEFMETQKARSQLLRELKRQPSSQGADAASAIPEIDIASKTYPKINLDAPGLRVLNQEPPIYMVDNFLNDQECNALIQTAKGGELESVKYSAAYALIDYKRLWPIFPMLALSAVPQSHALESSISLQTLENYFQVLGPNALLVGTMLVLVPKLIEILSPFLSKAKNLKQSSKWVGLSALDEQHPARRAQESLLQRAENLCFAQRTQFERPTVTRYQKGQGQAVHSDAYHPPEPGKEDEYLAGGGQRMAQCLVYLNDVPAEDGGATKFFHPSTGGLEVQPKKGSALVFFPAFEDGTEDPRMMHSGETYVGDNSKWSLGTWLHQGDVPLVAHRQ